MARRRCRTEARPPDQAEVLGEDAEAAPRDLSLRSTETAIPCSSMSPTTSAAPSVRASGAATQRKRARPSSRLTELRSACPGSAPAPARRRGVGRVDGRRHFRPIRVGARKAWSIATSSRSGTAGRSRGPARRRAPGAADLGRRLVLAGSDELLENSGCVRCRWPTRRGPVVGGELDGLEAEDEERALVVRRHARTAPARE